MQETIQLSAQLEINSPALFEIIKKTPVLLFDKNRTDTYITDFEKYLEILKMQLLNRRDTDAEKTSEAD